MQQWLSTDDGGGAGVEGAVAPPRGARYRDGVRELDVVGVRVEMPSNQPIVLLRERGGDRYLPIWIGASEATAIAHAQQGVVPPRPLTHDLLRNVIEALGRRLVEVRIVAIRDNVFHAELVFDGGLTVGSRSSDAIALALRTGSRIVGADEVLDAGGVAVPDEDEDEVERFRKFLEQISPEDFGEETPGPQPGT
jgi:bifunctional DNase/RNase